MSATPPLTLVIGNKNLSSWSLRPWLALEHTGAAYSEIVVPLDRAGTAAAIGAHSPSGRVPALKIGDQQVVWDSLAIVETLHELVPAARLWPDDPVARAYGRSITAEMHSGFAALRQNMSMNITARKPGQGRAPGVDADIARVTTIWREARATHGRGGPFLLGAFSIADCFYAPVATRFVTYGVALDADAQAYVDAILAWPAMKKWIAAAAAESK